MAPHHELGKWIARGIGVGITFSIAFFFERESYIPASAVAATLLFAAACLTALGLAFSPTQRRFAGLLLVSALVAESVFLAATTVIALQYR